MARMYPVLPALVTFGIILYRLDRRQLWRDEFASYVDARLPVAQVLRLARHTDAALLPYYLLIHWWMRLFGSSEIALRLPSALAMALAAGLLAHLGQTIYGRPVGLIAGLLLGILPAVSRYGQEARPYAMVVAATVLSAVLLLRATRRHRRSSWLWYSLSITLIASAHMVALVVLLSHTAYIGYRVARTRHWTPALWWSAAVLVGLLLAAPLLWLSVNQTAQVSWITTPRLADAPTWVAGLTGSLTVGGMLLGAAVLGCARGGIGVAALATWAWGPLLTLAAIATVTPLLTARYLLFTLPAWCLLAGLGIWQAAK